MIKRFTAASMHNPARGKSISSPAEKCNFSSNTCQVSSDQNIVQRHPASLPHTEPFVLNKHIFCIRFKFHIIITTDCPKRFLIRLLISRRCSSSCSAGHLTSSIQVYPHMSFPVQEDGILVETTSSTISFQIHQNFYL